MSASTLVNCAITLDWMDLFDSFEALKERKRFLWNYACLKLNEFANYAKTQAMLPIMLPTHPNFFLNNVIVHHGRHKCVQGACGSFCWQYKHLIICTMSSTEQRSFHCIHQRIKLMAFKKETIPKSDVLLCWQLLEH